MGRWTRRFFLGSGVAVTGLAGISLFACSVPSARQAGMQYDRLDVLLPDIVDPARVGSAFRARMGDDGLRALAARNPHITGALRHDCSATRQHLLKAGIRQEFAARNVVLCDRFVLSETECIVAGLRFEQRGAGPRAELRTGA